MEGGCHRECRTMAREQMYPEKGRKEINEALVDRMKRRVNVMMKEALDVYSF